MRTRIKTALRVGGTVVAAVGLLCLPVGVNVFQKRDLSVFHNIADLGVFIKAGLTLIATGVAAVGLSALIRADADE